MATAPLPAVLLVAVAMAHDCSPDNQDLGEAALFVWPFVALFALVVQRIVLELWRPLVPTIDRGWRRVLVLVAGMGIAPLVVGLTAKGNRWGLWAFFMLWMFGASYTSVVLVATRVLLRVAPQIVTIGAQLAASVLFIPLALVLALDLWLGAPSFLSFFLYLGYGGVATSCVFAALLAEVVVRRARAPRP